jgi:hypothetical protein
MTDMKIELRGPAGELLAEGEGAFGRPTTAPRATASSRSPWMTARNYDERPPADPALTSDYDAAFGGWNRGGPPK